MPRICSALILLFTCLHALAADLQSFPNARLVPNPANDGDSFYVAFNGTQQLVRLYFVDCPEISAYLSVDARRIRQQTRYFGVAYVADVIQVGRQATKFTDAILSKPFTVYTAFASALGRSKKGRIYAFIITSTGNDLASLLVARGYARAYGFGRQTPGGVSRAETRARLSDLEISAMLKRVGLWAKSDPDRIVQLRAEQRAEDNELKAIQAQAAKLGKPTGKINLNQASKEELELIKGIGPILAERIIQSRPFKTLDELLKVKGIGKKNFETFRSYLVIDPK